jgi:murein L,D-transpeptidase YafK
MTVSGSSRAARALSRVVVLSLLLSAGGCEMLPGIFGEPPQPAVAPAAVNPVPAKPRLADHVVVLKSKRLLELLHNGEVFATYPVALGPHAKGPKREASDGRTPEGRYLIDWRSERTRYTRELHISYPNEKDRARADSMHVEPGGGIFIHGLPRNFGPYDPPHWERDWTEGCISVGNAAIVSIWGAVPDGTPMDIMP